tara:strand:- start:3604 stop:4653 length:1050 start_codon:yes stop_codon:yes gene_type:complete
MIKSIVKKIFNLIGFDIRRISKVGKSSKIIPNFEKYDIFTTIDGNQINLLDGYKNYIWPESFDEMVRDQSIPDGTFIKRNRIIDKAREKLKTFTELLNIFGFGYNNKNILEIGCYNGALSYLLAEKGARMVDGIDIKETFITEENHAMLLSPKFYKDISFLEYYQEQIGKYFDSKTLEKTRFFNSSIDNYKSDISYDYIFSYATFEHLMNPLKALKNMYNILNKGGICIHIYHPFFCEDGAHFDCFDFPWGHVRLSEKDIKKYIDQYWVEDSKMINHRLFNTINRMTLADLRRYSILAGFEILLFQNNYNLYSDRMDEEIFWQSKEIYNNLSFEDCLSGSVTIVLKKNN